MFSKAFYPEYLKIVLTLIGYEEKDGSYSLGSFWGH